MKQNRKVSRRRSVIGMHVMHFGAIMLMFVVMVIVHLLASSSCGQLMKSIGEQERLIKARQNELDSANAMWRQATSTDNIARILHRRGLEMGDPQSDYVIHFDRTGKPNENERSVALLRSHQRDVASVVAPKPRSRR